MTIADRIKKVRELFGITSNEFAEITGIHPVSIRKYETNKMVPGIEVIDKMCKALKLPRSIFEGIPEQYTDYNFKGDFYQELFMSIANSTVQYHGFDVEKPADKYTLNPLLGKYITLKHGNQEIPLEEFSFVLNSDSPLGGHNMDFYMCMDFYNKADAALNDKKWNLRHKSETKEEYAARLKNVGDAFQLELMLKERSWRQYMDGAPTPKDFKTFADQIQAEGGSYYDAVEQMDWPDSEKQRYIKSYEDAYIEGIIRENFPEYPHGKSMEECMEWSQNFKHAKEKYKEDHPNYKEEARAHANSYRFGKYKKD